MTAGAVIVSASVADAVVTPVAVALIVTDVAPVAAVAATVKVSVADVAPDAIVAVDAVTPVGRPIAATETSPEKPPVRVRLTVTLPAVP